MDIHYSVNQSFRKYKINEDFIPNFLVELYFNFATPVPGSAKLYQKFFDWHWSHFQITGFVQGEVFELSPHVRPVCLDASFMHVNKSEIRMSLIEKAFLEKSF